MIAIGAATLEAKYQLTGVSMTKPAAVWQALGADIYETSAVFT